LSIGAVCLDPNSLDEKSSFYSLVHPEDWETVEEEALQVNKLTKEELEKAPSADVVWKQFTQWVKSYNKGRSGTYQAAVRAGFNILGYDDIIMRRYCKKYGIWDDKRHDQAIFNQLFAIDVMQYMWYLSYSNTDLKSLKLTDILDYMGVPQSVIASAHNSLVDSQNTAMILRKLLNLSRYLTERNEQGQSRLKIKGSLANLFGESSKI